MTIEKQGLPNEFTQGEVGDIYIDTDTGFKFICTSKISIHAGVNTNYKYVWMPIRENYKLIASSAAEALSDKLQEDVSTDGLVSAIEGIDVGSVIAGLFWYKFSKYYNRRNNTSDLFKAILYAS